MIEGKSSASSRSIPSSTEPHFPFAAMKNLVAVLAASVLAAATSDGLPTTRLPAEWLVPASSPSKNFALVDAATGTVRLAVTAADGSVNWSQAIPTGIANVSDVTAAINGSLGEILALTSPDANRVGLLNIATASPYLYFLPQLSGVGPSGLASLGTTPNRELIAASIFNGTTQGKLEVRNQISTTGTLLAETPQNKRFRRLQPLTAPGSATAIALYTASSGSNTEFGLVSRSGTTLTVTVKGTLTNSVEFATDVRSPHHPTKIFSAGYRSGADTVQLIEFSAPLTTASTILSNSVSLPFPVSTLIPILGGGAGPMTDGFIALASNGSEARWFRINATANGLTDAGPAHAFTPAPGQSLAGIVPVPGIGIVKLQSATNGAPSSSFVSTQWNGSAWATAASGTLPPIPSPLTAAATLLFYSKNPATDEAARLLGIQSAGSWTRRSSSPDPVPASVLTESFNNSLSGLTLFGSQPITPAFGTNHVITNQVEPAVSISALGSFDALSSPDLGIEPPSGPQEMPFQVIARFDAQRQELLYQRDQGAWTLWTGPLPVAWNTTFRFTLRAITSGNLGPIVTRSYTLPLTSIATTDSDHDGVPDYVELFKGLNPFGGPDSDGDGTSDLDEILHNTNPANPASFPATTFNIAPSGGMSLVAIARDHTGAEVANLEMLQARAIDGRLLAGALVNPFAPTLPDGGNRGAILKSSAAPPFDELIAVSSPTYFNIITNLRTGRETIRFVPSTPPPAFTPAFTPSGSSLAADAAGWISAATAAAGAHPSASARTALVPADSAVAVLLEHLVHNALVLARPPAEPAPALDAFSFLPGRDPARASLTPADRARLQAAGFDFRRALNLATAAKASMQVAADNFYARHVLSAETTPGMPMPIDALRTVLRGDAAPANYAGAVTTAILNSARAAYDTALASLATAYRPRATWEIEIPASSPGPGVYLRMPGATPVALLTAAGDRFLLEQGLGLLPGTRFHVTGFTDTPAAGTYPTLEITAASITFEPAASDHDSDGNLLDDEWELFFFGSIGQNPFSTPGLTGHTLLEYFLSGLDPRGATSPSVPPMNLAPQNAGVFTAANGDFIIDFNFPDAYQSQFNFTLEKSTSIDAGTFIPVPSATIVPHAPHTLRATVPASAAPAGNHFFRVRLALAGS
jgi:hypothetical protein